LEENKILIETNNHLKFNLRKILFDLKRHFNNFHERRTSFRERTTPTTRRSRRASSKSTPR
jgi:hypothetical protein